MNKKDIQTKSDEKKKIKEIITKRRFVRLTPDKLRLAASLIKNKDINQALAILRFSKVAAAKPLEMTLKSALAQARDKDISEDLIFIKAINIDEGPKLKRRRIIHQGRATAILKRMSHITVVLSDKTTEIKTQKSNVKRK